MPRKETADGVLSGRRRKAVSKHLDCCHLLRFLNEDLTEENYEQLFSMVLAAGAPPGKCTLPLDRIDDTRMVVKVGGKHRKTYGKLMGERVGKSVRKTFREKVSLWRAKELQAGLRILFRGQPIREPDMVFMEPENLLLYIAFDWLYRGPAKISRCPQCQTFFILAKTNQVSCGARPCVNRQNQAKKPPRGKVHETETTR